MLPAIVWAGVNPKNGNFHISYTDLVVGKQSQKIRISRTYNSTSTYSGWFGFGWGSKYETHLVPLPDGTIVINERGSGERIRYYSDSKSMVKTASKKIVKTLKRKNAILGQFANKLYKKLIEDADLRYSYSKRLKLNFNFEIGTLLYAKDKGGEKIRVIKGGYKRLNQYGDTEFFDWDGRLIKIKY